MIRHGWKVGLLAAAVSLIGVVRDCQAAPPATTSEVVAKTETTVDDSSGIEQTGYRRQRRIQRLIERERRENGYSGYSGDYSGGDTGNSTGGYAEGPQESASFPPDELPALSDSMDPVTPPAPATPAPSSGPAGPTPSSGPVPSPKAPFTKRTTSSKMGGVAKSAAPAKGSITKASAADQKPAAAPPRKMQRVQPSQAEVVQPGMSGYPAGYCPADNCQNYGYPAGYCPAGNCQVCDGCPCPSCCHGCCCLKNCFKKLATCNHCKLHPMSPGYIDDRDTTYYSAQGYGLPVVVPMAPNVRHQYNYGWGLPSSRITKVPYGFPQYYPQQFHSMAGSPQVHGEHPPMVYWPTDTTQLGIYGRRVPHWSPMPNVP